MRKEKKTQKEEKKKRMTKNKVWKLSSAHQKEKDHL